MFISRKKYKESLAKAAEDAVNKVYERQYLDDSMRRANERMDDLEKRMQRLENPDVTIRGFCGKCPPPTPDAIIKAY